VLLIFDCVALNRTSAFPGWWLLVPKIVAALIIVAGPQSWLNPFLLALRTLVAISLISYPLYLVHWPQLSFLNIVLGHLASLAIRGAAVTASFFLAWLTYRFVEKPISFAKNGMLIAKKS
jgi:peptidoglycan/LPS O-acetylase OafA/YrhL